MLRDASSPVSVHPKRYAMLSSAANAVYQSFPEPAFFEVGMLWPQWLAGQCTKDKGEAMICHLSNVTPPL